MRLRHVLFLVILAMLLGLAVKAARAEEVIETWRGGGFEGPLAVSANPSDGSCWVAAGDEIVHLAEDGTELWRGGGFNEPWSVSANPTDGSCWGAGGWDVGWVVRLAENGTELWRGGDFSRPGCVSVNSTDGSCWVSDDGNGEIVHVAEDGTELWRGGGFERPFGVSVNPADGSCWVALYDANQVLHLAEDGTELLRVGGLLRPGSVSVNPRDGTCWVADEVGAQVVHLAEDGTELWRGAGFENAYSVSVNPADGSCWVREGGTGDDLVHLAEDGTELWRGDGFGMPNWIGSTSVNPSDGSCWVADHDHEQVVHLVIPGWQPSVFYDVPWYHWAFDEVKACVDADIVGGYSPTRYEPTVPVSRDQMAVFISRSIATPTGEMSLDDYVPPTTPSFSDVPTDFWCYKYIEYAVENDIVGGYGDGTYQPQVTIDRGQMAVFIARAMAGDDESVPDPVGDPSFPDVPADFWSYRHIEYIADQEVAGGYFDGLYHPENPVDRAQMAVFICRAFDLP
jgi:hypothetical protein